MAIIEAAASRPRQARDGVFPDSYCGVIFRATVPIPNRPNEVELWIGLSEVSGKVEVCYTRRKGEKPPNWSQWEPYPADVQYVLAYHDPLNLGGFSEAVDGEVARLRGASCQS